MSRNICFGSLKEQPDMAIRVCFSALAFIGQSAMLSAPPPVLQTPPPPPIQPDCSGSQVLQSILAQMQLDNDLHHHYSITEGMRLKKPSDWLQVQVALVLLERSLLVGNINTSLFFFGHCICVITGTPLPIHR